MANELAYFTGQQFRKFLGLDEKGVNPLDRLNVAFAHDLAAIRASNNKAGTLYARMPLYLWLEDMGLFPVETAEIVAALNSAANIANANAA